MREMEVTYLMQQYDFLLTWRPVSGLGDVFTPAPGVVAHLPQHALSEAEALQHWLAAGGGLDVAFRYGLEIIAGDDALTRYSQESYGEEVQARTV
jgi:hypothetical protein